MPIPDTTGVERSEGGSYPPIIEGEYELELTGFEDYTAGSGNKCTRLKIKVVKLDRKASGNLVHTANSLWKVGQFKDAIRMADDETDLTHFIGSRFKGVCKNTEDKKGNNYINVDEYYPLVVNPPCADDYKPENSDSDEPPF